MCVEFFCGYSKINLDLRSQDKNKKLLILHTLQLKNKTRLYYWKILSNSEAKYLLFSCLAEKLD
jgi:hypothetical protein